ncbi:MAG: hypothetical protein KDD69_06580, partial [Bdellovibrionales bacterium]|nr:hypothetical protein [Bdellovibrionales bacterium]
RMTAIVDFRNVHEGKRLFVLASGPSLEALDLQRLERRLVMGLNRSFFAYPQTHYHCMFDHRLFELYPEASQDTRYLFTLPGRPHGIGIPLLGAEGFSWDLEQGIYSGYTIAYFALQVAVYLGFREIVYLGLDLCHVPGKTHFFGSDFNSRTHESTEFPRMQKALTGAAISLRKRGIRVINCSPISTLQCFERMSFEEAVAL